MHDDEILAALQHKRARDARWQDGRTFGMVFDGGPEVRDIAESVAAMFLHENALNTAAFPSLAEIQSEVVAACEAHDEDRAGAALRAHLELAGEFYAVELGDRGIFDR